LKDGAKPIKFDWEHTEYKFIKPEDVQNYDHVPQLEVGMQRVTVSPETETALAVLRNDHESGAQGLALKALNILLKAVRGEELARLSTSQDFWRELRWRAWHLAKNGRPSMGAAIESELFKALDLVAKELVSPGSKGIDGIPLTILKSNTESAISTRISATKHSLEYLAQHCVEFVERSWTSVEAQGLPLAINIVTLSSSGTITRSLAKLVESVAKKGVDIKIAVLESRPGFEGVAFVNSLLASFKGDKTIISKLKMEIISDASVATALKDAHYLVFGGDKVIPNGDVSNKIGTLTAAVMSKILNPSCKVVALFATNKITGSGFDAGHLNIEYNDESEVTNAWPAAYLEQLKKRQAEGYQVEVKNAYFEWVPAEYIDQYISEEGPLSQEDIVRLGSESEELEHRIFGDLESVAS